MTEKNERNEKKPNFVEKKRGCDAGSSVTLRVIALRCRYSEGGGRKEGTNGEEKEWGKK
jgi:hypothetical protein